MRALRCICRSVADDTGCAELPDDIRGSASKSRLDYNQSQPAEERAMTPGGRKGVTS
jgi:hypothetical protein